MKNYQVQFITADFTVITKHFEAETRAEVLAKIADYADDIKARTWQIIDWR